MLKKTEVIELSENDLEDVNGGGGLLMGVITCPTYIWYDCTNPSCGNKMEQPSHANPLNCGRCNSPMKVRNLCPQCGSKLVTLIHGGNINCYDCQMVTYPDGSAKHI